MQAVTLPPIPPSDSLYKFKAIGGLLVVALSFYIPFQMVFELKMATFALALEVKQFRLAQERIGRRLQDVNKNSEHLREDSFELTEFELLGSNDLDHISKYRLIIQKSLQHLERAKGNVQEMNDIRVETDKMLRVLAQIENAIEKEMYLSRRMAEVFSIAVLVIGFGLWMMFSGFHDWYYKFQIYQDRIVKAQAEQWTTPKPEREKDEILG